MATISSHALNSVTGVHASDLRVELYRIEPSGMRVLLLETRTDEGGRLTEELTLIPSQLDLIYELVFDSAGYFSALNSNFNNRVVQEVVVRLQMKDPQATYHIPIMLAPNSFSAWWSAVE